MRKIITLISLIIFIFGISSFLFNSSISSGRNTYDGELPITSIQGIIEKKGKIYVGLGVYNRIQIYDLKGNYISSINIKNYSKDFNFYINDQGNPIVNIIYLRKEPVYNYLQKDGSIYFVESKIPLSISKIDNNGTHIIIKQPTHMSLWAGIIIPWMIGAFGILLLLITNTYTIISLLNKISKK